MKKILLFAITLLMINVLGLSAQDTKIEKSYTKEIDKLAKNKQIEAAFATIVALEPLSQSDLILLTEIEAPPFKEEKRAAQYKYML